MKRLNQDSEQVGNLPFKLLKHMLGPNPHNIDDERVMYTTYQMFFAGVSTTTETLNSFFNILVHYPNVQAKLQAEVDEVLQGADVKIDDRNRMPYTQATILELLRY